MASYYLIRSEETVYGEVPTITLEELNSEQFLNRLHSSTANCGSRFYVEDGGQCHRQQYVSLNCGKKMIMSKNDNDDIENDDPQKNCMEKGALGSSYKQVPIYDSTANSGNYIHLLLEAADYLENSSSSECGKWFDSSVVESDYSESSFEVTSPVKATSATEEDTHSDPYCEFVRRSARIKAKAFKLYLNDEEVEEDEKVSTVSSSASSSSSGSNAAMDREYTCDENGAVEVVLLKCLFKNCEEAVFNKTQLDKHLLAKHQLGAYRCIIGGCLEKAVNFTKKGEYTAHLEMEHSDDQVLFCGQCHKHFKNIYEVSKHYFQEHELGHFLCGEGCGFESYLNRALVLKHRRQEHTGARSRLPCSQCSKTFAKLPELKRHLNFHRGVKPYACPSCNAAFTLKGDLTKHERIHSGEKPFFCCWIGCTYSAPDRSSVSGHVRTRHFKIPRNKAEQKRRGIVDNRDAKKFIGRKR